MRLVGPVLTCSLASLVACAVVACSEADRDASGRVAVRVAGMPISVLSVDHWSAAIAHGASVLNPLSSPRQSPREQALTFLISSRWLLTAAAEQGLKPAPGWLDRALEERTESIPGGAKEFSATLVSVHQTVADIKLELQTQWAASALKRRIDMRADRIAREQISARQVRAYYRAHIARYRHREVRYYDLIERIKSEAAARAIARRLGSGQRFAEAAVKEQPPRPRSFELPRGEGAVLRAVFSAKIGVLVGPLRLRGGYCLFVLRRIKPARVQPLSELRGPIERALLTQRRRLALVRLVASYKRRWIARTDCSRAYVVQTCKQHSRVRIAEGDPFAGYP